ncbi:hypothetical protein ACPXBC_31510, partial [Escherichia coli]|uniref:hypothetical protein n=1 Tax=Escherichia coli TaxID=562 RepID=UPI003CE55303
RLVSATFEGDRRNALADSFYYSTDGEAGVQIAGGGLALGDGYELTAIEPVEDDPATLTAPGDDGGLSGGDNLRR